MSTPPVPNIPGASNVTSIETKRGRGRPKGAELKEHPTIPADEFVIEAIDRENRGSLRRVRESSWTREQEAVARKCVAVYKLWKDAGSPSDWNLMPVQGWVISKQFEEEALRLLYKGASRHSLKRVLGTIQRRSLPDLPLPEGKVRIPFCIVARKTEVTGLPTAEDSGADQ